MKIFLLQPYSEESNTNYPPMGLLYIAAYLRTTTSHEIRVLDMRIKKQSIDQYLAEIADWDPDIVGMTGMSIEWPVFKDTATKLRNALNEKTLFVAGGPHASIFTGMVFKDTPITCIVKGEGEHTFAEIVAAHESKQSMDSIKGIVYKTAEGETQATGEREPIEDLDSLPSPAFDLLDIEKYFIDPHFHGNLNTSGRVLPIVTSRGCPFKCGFCFHSMGYKYRARSPENVLAEIEHLIKTFDIHEIQVEDDTFNMKMDRAKEIMRGICKLPRKLAIAFPNGIRADALDQEMTDLFKQAGVYRIHFGIETVAPRVQEMLNKKIAIAKINNALELTNNAGISSHGFFIIGFPTETEEEMWTTINFSVKSKLATANYSILKVFPGTPLGEKYLVNDNKFSDSFSFGYDSTATNFSAVSDKRLKEIQNMAMLKFYLKPSRLWRIFRTSPNKIQLFTRNVGTVLSLLVRGKTKY